MDNACMCGNYFDLNLHLPMQLFCENRHTICKTCLDRMYNEGGFINCPYDNENDTRDRSEYRPNSLMRQMLEENSINCFEDKNIGKCFDTVSGKAYCANHGYKEEEKRTFKFNIISKLISTYLENKRNFSTELKKTFRDALKSKILQKKLSFLYAMQLYICFDTILYDPTNIYPERDEEFYFIDPERFKIYCSDHECSPYEKTNYLRELYSKSIGSLLDSQWFFNKALSNHNNQISSYSKRLVELIYIKQNDIKSISWASCPFCLKGIQVGQRMPCKLSCGHLLCNFCRITNNFCVICQFQPSSSVLCIDQDSSSCLYITPPSCKNCTGLVKTLPFHCICNCIFCEVCITQTPTLSCKECVNIEYPNKNFYLKVSKTALNLQRYLFIDIICWCCKQNKAKYFSKENHFTLCSECDKVNPQASSVLLNGGYDLDYHLIMNYWSYFDSGLNFMTSRINKKLQLINNLYYPCKEQLPYQRSYSCLDIEEVKFYSIIYPLNVSDRRHYSVKQNAQIKVFLDVNLPISLCGLIIGGNIDNTKTEVEVLVNADVFSINQPKTIIGKYGYVMFTNYIRATLFEISLTYKDKYKLFTGISRQTVVHHNITFTKNGNMNGKIDHSLSSPLLGLVYSTEKDLSDPY